MQKWIIKSAVQRAISWLPQSYRWNALIQKYVARTYRMTRKNCEAKLRHCSEHIENYFAHSPSPSENFAAIELGTGWWPVLPIGMYLCGARSIATYDIAPLLSRPAVSDAINFILQIDQEGKLSKLLPRVKTDRITCLRELSELRQPLPASDLLRFLKIQVCVRDACNTGQISGTIDLVFSNVVLEHLPTSLQAMLYAEFKRILSPHGLMSHHVGMADQFAMFDRSITPYNFLKYPSSTWRFLDSPMVPQTRLRASDYRRAMEQSGFNVLAQRNVSGSPTDLKKVPLAPEFQNYSEDDLLVLYAWFVARPGSDCPPRKHLNERESGQLVR